MPDTDQQQNSSAQGQGEGGAEGRPEQQPEHRCRHQAQTTRADALPQRLAAPSSSCLSSLCWPVYAFFFYYRSTFTEGTDDAQVDGDLYPVSARIAGSVIQVNVTENQKVQQGRRHRHHRSGRLSNSACPGAGAGRQFSGFLCSGQRQRSHHGRPDAHAGLDLRF